MISAVLLAAGESRRMNDFKQLLPLAGKSFVECCVDNLLASRVEEVVVVTGHREADVRQALGDRPVRFAHNANYLDGMSASIKRGVEALPDSTEAMLLALVDQPQIGPAIINRVIEAYESERALVVVPTYEGRNGHPIIINLKLRDDVLAMDPATGLRQVVHAHQAQTAYVEIPSREVLIDFDLPEDYLRIKDT